MYQEKNAPIQTATLYYLPVVPDLISSFLFFFLLFFLNLGMAKMKDSKNIIT